MSKPYFITSYCHIKENRISLNGKLLFETTGKDFSEFVKSATVHLQTNYPRFFKMDHLSKLSFLAADVILKDAQLSAEIEHNIAIILSNRASSLDTDRKHQKSIDDKDQYFPSPSVFVYTLPNICIGEISIKHQLFSENSFFIFERFNAEHLFINANSLLKSKKADQVLCGWVDFDEDTYEAFLYLVAENGIIAHNTSEITKLYINQ